MSHVGLQDDRAPSREWRSFHLGARELIGFFEGHVEALDELPEEVTRTLGAARVFAKDLVARSPQFEDREAMAPDGDERRLAGVAGQCAIARRLGLLGRDSQELDVSAESAGDCSTADPRPIPVT